MDEQVTIEPMNKTQCFFHTVLDLREKLMIIPNMWSKKLTTAMKSSERQTLFSYFHEIKKYQSKEFNIIKALLLKLRLRL